MIGPPTAGGTTAWPPMPPAKILVDFWNACPPTASPLRLPQGDFGTSRLQLAYNTTRISSARKRGVMVGSGTKLPIRDVRCSVANGGKADVSGKAHFGSRRPPKVFHSAASGCLPCIEFRQLK